MKWTDASATTSAWEAEFMFLEAFTVHHGLFYKLLYISYII